MKQLKVDGSGEFAFIKIGGENEEELHAKHDTYQADDWADATEEEYNDSIKAVEVDQIAQEIQEEKAEDNIIV